MFKTGVCYDDESTNQYFAYFNDIEGIDGEQIVDVESEIYQIKLINGTLSLKFQEQLKNGLTQLPENIYLDVFDNKNNQVGQFFLAIVKIIDVDFISDNTVNLKLNAYMHSARPGRYKSWKMKLLGEIDCINKWLDLKPSERQGWLGMALQNNLNDQTDRKNVVIDGKLIDDRDSFYCVFGESINGPGGYFGRNLDAVVDCLRGGFGPIPKSVVWKNSEFSQSKVKGFDEFVFHLSEIFIESFSHRFFFKQPTHDNKTQKTNNRNNR